MVTHVKASYTIEQAEEDIANLRGQVDQLTEILKFTDSAADWANTGAGAWLYSLLGVLKYASTDGNAYDTGQLMLRYTGAGQTINSTSGTTPAGMSAPVAARTYFVLGLVAGTQGATAAVQAIRITGPAASQVLMGYLVSNFGDFGAAGIASNFSQVSALNTDLSTSGAGGGINANANFQWMLLGLVTFTAAGTLALQARCVTSNLDPWTFQPNSHLLLFPIA